MVKKALVSEELAPLLATLEDSSSPPEDKTDAYLRLVEDLSQEEKQFGGEISNISSNLLILIKRDIVAKEIDLSQAALQTVGYCLYQEQIVKSLKEDELTSIIDDLCKVARGNEDKNICTRALWSLGKQQIAPKIVQQQVAVILKSVEMALLNFASPTVEKEALEVIYRLLNQLASDVIVESALHWSRLVYPLLISSAHKIREKALGILELGLQPILLVRDSVVPGLVNDLKATLLAELTKCFADKKEIFVLRAWTVLIAILGEAVHKNGTLVNAMLKIPEEGFKSSLPNVQSMSYNAWICLIDNFALSSTFFASLKRIKLLMMPLTKRSSKSVHQDIEFARSQTWWHLICTIKSNHSKVIFNEVCIPLLQYYFDINPEGPATPAAKDTVRELIMPVTPVASNKAGVPGPGTPATITPSKGRKKVVTLSKARLPEASVKQLLLLACEMLMEILAVDKTEMKKSKRLYARRSEHGFVNILLRYATRGRTTIEHLTEEILDPTYFCEHHLLILNVVKTALVSCVRFVNESVISSIWHSVVQRTVDMVQTGASSDVESSLGTLFATAHDLITSSVLPTNLVMIFLQELTKVPHKYLLHSYVCLTSICSQGKPLFLVNDLLFEQLPSFKEAYVDERFHIVFEAVIDACLATPQKLRNLHKIWLSLEAAINNVHKIEDLWRLWSDLMDSVSTYVTKTSDVNQGDSLEHDFSLMLCLISCPFKYLFTNGLPGVTIKEMNRNLSDFFQLFSRCGSLVSTAEPNTCVENVARQLLAVTTLEKCRNNDFLDGICNFIDVMVDNVDFSSLSPLPTPSHRPNLSPLLKTKHASPKLGNLNGLVLLCAEVLTHSYEVEKVSTTGSVVAPAITVLAGALSKLFSHLTVAEHIQECIKIISKPLEFYFTPNKSSTNSFDSLYKSKKPFNAKLICKIEKVWTDILTCLQSRYKEAYSSSLLKSMSGLLETTFCHSRNKLRNQTLMFWNATFAHADHLEYPPSLRACLETVSEKSSITLPGWKKIEKTHLENPASLMQDSEETTPKENMTKPQVSMLGSPMRKHGAASPAKMKGSFLHKALSADKTDRRNSQIAANLESFSAKRKSPAGANVRRKLPLSLDSADDKEFVVIAPSPKKKRLLTEHQKEVRKTKKIERDVPPLYNMLDQSQDGTQFSQLTQSFTQSFDPQNTKECSVIMDAEINTCTEQSKMSNTAIIPSPDDDSQKMDEGRPLVEEPTSSVKGKEDITTKHGDPRDECDSEMSSPEFIPSSQTSGSNSSADNGRRRSVISFQKTSNCNRMPALAMSAPMPAAILAENSLPCEDEDQSLEDCHDVEACSESTGKISTTSPVSSRTRHKRKPMENTPSATNESKESVSNPQEVASEQKVPESLELTDACQQFEKDQPLCDEQKCENDVMSENSNSTKDNSVVCDEQSSISGAPSSPVNVPAVKLVHSKTAATCSPLRRPNRNLSSPVPSPTGILKRYVKGRPDTPSPPGKTRRVSFAFPLREEKEFNTNLPANESTEIKAKPADEEKHFTSIKVTPTQSEPLSKAMSPNECIYPELVECLTPVEQILPSLATSRWSRGLGHLVHAQNIRTIGNLSALTENQVKKLPIRSPKVSTLRRVLRNFHESYSSKSPKANQQRELKATEGGLEVDDAGCDVAVDENVDIGEEKVAVVVLCDENHNDLSEKCYQGSFDVVMEPSEPVQTIIGEKILTPRRSRSLAKPTTLFNSNLAEIKENTHPPSEDEHTEEAIIPKCGDNVTRYSEKNDDSCTKDMETDVVVGKESAKDKLIDLPTDMTKQREQEILQVEEDIACVVDERSNGSSLGKTAPIVQRVGNLVSLETEQLAQLPLTTLFTCHEQLTNVLSNIMSAIKSKSVLNKIDSAVLKD